MLGVAYARAVEARSEKFSPDREPKALKQIATGASATVPCELAATHPMVDEMDAGGSRGIC